MRAIFVFGGPLLSHPTSVYVRITNPKLQFARVGEACSPFGVHPLSHWTIKAIGWEGADFVVHVV